MQSILIAAKEKARLLVEAIIESELSYMFTSDKNYLETRTSFIPQLSEEEKEEISKEVDDNSEEAKKERSKRSIEIEKQKKEQIKQLDKLQKMSDKELYVIELRKRIDTYFHIVIRNIRDQIPKVIGFFLVKGSQDKLQFELYNKLISYPGVLKTIGEAPRITEERNTLTKAQATLEGSLKVMKRSLESVGMDEDEEEIFYEIEKAKKEMKNKKDKNKNKAKGNKEDEEDSHKIEIIPQQSPIEKIQDPVQPLQEKEPEKVTQEGKESIVANISTDPKFLKNQRKTPLYPSRTAMEKK